MAIVDIHSHLIPGVDDGAQNVDETDRGLEAFVKSGVTAIVATPHVDASLSALGKMENRLDEIDRGWKELRKRVKARFPDLKVYRAVELKLDTPQPVLDDARLRINGGRFLLMEFPFMMVPPRSTEVLREITASGRIPIIAHPERYSGVNDSLSIVREWKDAGAFLQVNGGSIVGRYGDDARKLAKAILDEGLADIVASDFHGRGRTHVTEYRSSLQQIGGDEYMDVLTRLNPERVIDDQFPLPVQRPPRRGIWSRITGVLR